MQQGTTRSSGLEIRQDRSLFLPLLKSSALRGAWLSGELCCASLLPLLTEQHWEPSATRPWPKGLTAELLKQLVVSTSTPRVAQLAHLGWKGCLVDGAASFQEHLANVMILPGC